MARRKVFISRCLVSSRIPWYNEKKRSNTPMREERISFQKSRIKQDAGTAVKMNWDSSFSMFCKGGFSWFLESLYLRPSDCF